MSNEPKTRTWSLEPEIDDEGVLYPVSEDEFDRELLKIHGILQRVGGVVYIASDRVRLEDESFITAGYVFRYESFVPARRGVARQAGAREQAEVEAQALADEVNVEPPPEVPEPSEDSPETEGEEAHRKAAEDREDAKNGLFGGAVTGPTEAEKAVAAVDEALT